MKLSDKMSIYTIFLDNKQNDSVPYAKLLMFDVGGMIKWLHKIGHHGRVAIDTNLPHVFCFYVFLWLGVSLIFL